MEKLGLVTQISPHLRPYFEINNHHLKNRIEYIFVLNKHVVFYNESTVLKMGRIRKSQMELPIEAAQWLVDVVENKFMKKPSEGGLAKDVFNTREMVNGEDLSIRWGVSVAGEGIGGYTISNLSRLDYTEKWQSEQEFVIAGDIMVEQVLPVLKEIAQKHKNGELD